MNNRHELFKEMFKPETLEPKNTPKPASISLLNPEPKNLPIAEELGKSDITTLLVEDRSGELKLEGNYSRFSREFELHADEETLKELYIQGKRKNIMSEERFLREMKDFL